MQLARGRVSAWLVLWSVLALACGDNIHPVTNLVVSPSSGLETTEAGGTATFTIALLESPYDKVSVSITSTDLTEGTVSPSSIELDMKNWDTPQTITITGVDDTIVDGDQAYAILLDTGSNNGDSVAVVNLDDDGTSGGAKITVTPTSGLITTEAGGTATFSVVLTAQPTADVAIALSSSDLTEGTVSTASLTFTAANFSTPQTVTVTGVDDAIVDGDQPYSIVLGAATSTDARYAGIDPADVAVTNTDNDGISTASIVVTPSSGLVTTESGGTAQFTVALAVAPTANVTIPVSSSDLTEGTVSTASLVFTPANFNAPQTVTVTGVDDAIVDGNQPYTIVLGAAASTDVRYAGIDPSDVSVTNLDNDGVSAASIVVAPTTGLVTTESGGTAQFTVVLAIAPTANVTIPVSSSDLTEGTVSTASLTFTPANFNAPQTVTVTGVDDAIVDGNQPYAIILGTVASADVRYAGIDPSDVSVTNLDNDGVSAASIVVAPTTGLVTTESGGTAQFTVVLLVQPTASVTIPVSSSDLTEGTVSTASLVFTPANFNAPQTVTVTGVDDAIVDGNQPYTIVLSAAASTDVRYAGIDASDVSVTNLDNDGVSAASIVVAPTTGLVTTESGGTAQFTVVLLVAPTANVTIPVSSSDLTEGTVSTASLTFTPANFNAPQTVTVTGVDDAIVDGNQPYTIVLSAAASTDVRYAGIDASDVSVTNLDNDSVSAASIVVNPTSGLVTTESGGTASFSVVLLVQPTANVAIPVSTSDPTEGTVSVSILVFTPANYSAPQTVIVIGVDDLIVDGNQPYSVILGAVVSADPRYAGIDPPDVSLVNLDNETAGVLVAPTTGLVTTEAGGSDTFDVVLLAQPTANVVIAVSSSRPSEGVASVTMLTFTPVDWNAPQTVTVTGVDDAIADGNQVYQIVLAPATSADPAYAGIDPSDVTVTNLDNDTAGILVSPTSGLVTTEAGGQDQLQVVLLSAPTADVTIAVTSSDLTEGTVFPATLTFTAANWFIPQTITVTGVDDALADGNQVYKVVLAPAVSADARYNGIDPSDATVTNIDNDSAGITVTPTSGLITTEFGDSDTFDIVLNSQPTAPVTITLTSSDLTEGTVSPAFVTFTPANFNVPQTVTVTGVDDTIKDGNQVYMIITGVASSLDLAYNGINPPDVQVTNIDNDTAQVFTKGRKKLRTSESGQSSFFRLCVTIAPTADVMCPVTSSDLTEGTVSPGIVLFPAGSTQCQTVTVTGVDDTIVDGAQLYTIITGACTSADPAYNGQNPRDLTALNRDND